MRKLPSQAELLMNTAADIMAAAEDLPSTTDPLELQAMKDIYDEANHFIMKYDYYIKKMSHREFQKKHQ